VIHAINSGVRVEQRRIIPLLRSFPGKRESRRISQLLL
jgi:hypothetical protein